jgi:hypothetical protein
VSNLLAHFGAKFNMPLIVTTKINFEGSSLPHRDENLTYTTSFIPVKRDVTTNKVDIEPSCEGGTINLGSLIISYEDIIASDSYQIVKTYKGQFFDIRSHTVKPHPPQTPTEKEYKAAILQVRGRFESLRRSLNTALYQESCSLFNSQLVNICHKYTNNDELVKLIISSNDRRIELLPFEETDFIKTAINRPVSVSFRLPQKGYLELSDPNTSRSQNNS